MCIHLKLIFIWIITYSKGVMEIHSYFIFAHFVSVRILRSFSLFCKNEFLVWLCFIISRLVFSSLLIFFLFAASCIVRVDFMRPENCWEKKKKNEEMPSAVDAAYVFFLSSMKIQSLSTRVERDRRRKQINFPTYFR